MDHRLIVSNVRGDIHTIAVKRFLKEKNEFDDITVYHSKDDYVVETPHALVGAVVTYCGPDPTTTTHVNIELYGFNIEDLGLPVNSYLIKREINGDTLFSLPVRMEYVLKAMACSLDTLIPVSSLHEGLQKLPNRMANVTSAAAVLVKDGCIIDFVIGAGDRTPKNLRLSLDGNYIDYD